MSAIVNHADVLRLLTDGAEVVEVLPNGEYDELHLSAISLPQKRLNAETVRHLDPSQDVVVYCFDGL